MTDIKFIKDHPSRRFKKGDIIQMPNENIEAWIKSGYCKLANEIGEALGNVESSSIGGEVLESNSKKQSKFGKDKKKKRGNK